MRAHSGTTEIATTPGTWAWRLTRPDFKQEGLISAIDPRDALSRVLTAELPTGKLFGEEHGIPVDVLTGAPGNSDTAYVAEGDGFTLKLRKMVGFADRVASAESFCRARAITGNRTSTREFCNLIEHEDGEPLIAELIRRSNGAPQLAKGVRVMFAADSIESLSARFGVSMPGEAVSAPTKRRTPGL